jgi:WhiB family redox-sensing transcriptional regulator
MSPVFDRAGPYRGALCGLPECGGEAHTRGLCRKHYEQWKRLGRYVASEPAGPGDASWMDSAACRTAADPDLWFPADDDPAGVDAARRVCAGCRVRVDCLAWAVAIGAADGVWGGLTTSQRRAQARQRVA